MECLEDRLHGFGVSQWNRSEFPLRARCINPNLRVLEQVPVPLRLGTKHRQKVNGLAFWHEPDRNRACLPGLSSDHADLDGGSGRGGL